MTDHAQIVAELTARWPEHKLVPTLGRIQALCGLLGDPQQAYPVIQVAGTNGKGSTCIMIESLLRAQGLRVGRFQSPHLQEIGERIMIDGEPMSPENFDEIYQQVKPLADLVDAQAIDGVNLTFFEFMTAMAYAAFADAPVDIAVVEVGMGGSWDSTNVVDAQVAVVCPIDLDHTHILGDTIAEITTEKAGIIKAGSHAVFAGQDPVAAKVLMERAIEVGAKVIREGVEFGLLDRQLALGGQVLRIMTSDGPVGDLHLPLHGAHMARNAALAIAAVETFQGGRALTPELIQEGFDLVKAPARLEVVRHDPTVILDTGHNPHGARATVDAVSEAFHFTPLIGVYSAMKDKDFRQVLEIYGEVMEHVVCTQVSNFDRAMPADELAEIAAEILGPERVTWARRMDEAVERAMAMADIQGGGNGGVLIAGSVIAAGEARTLLVKDIPANNFGDDIG
ncbi:MAG: bifunctional folylpolyglutamate synthase/dihydrofolate synthase [Propionibacteriaceae bacterium]